jgi:hypothetical protein
VNAGGEPGGSKVPDDEWDRFLRESAEGVHDAPKEPSAQDREATRQRQEKNVRSADTGWRTYPQARPRRRTGRYVAGLLAVLAVLVVVLAPGPVERLLRGDPGPDDAVLGAETARPSAPPPTADAERPTFDEPFRGSPAAHWADGAAGITVPKARATGWLDEAGVARALSRSKDFLVASSLDRAVLRGGRPTEAIGYVDPHQRQEREFIDTALSAPSRKDNPLVLFSRFDPADVRLVGDVVKVRGRLTYRQAPGGDGAVRVTSDVTYVYPVARADGRSDGDVTRVIVRREVVVDWADPAKVRTTKGTFSVVSNRLETTNAGCGQDKGFLDPPFGTPQGADGPATDPYDRSERTADDGGTADDAPCGVASRS